MAEKRKILVAESNGDAADEIAIVLRQRDFEIVLARDATAVLTMTLRHRPVAVIIGGRLHAGGSVAALRRLRSSVHTAAIPVIALAAPGPEMQALLAAGAEDCLDLPIEPNEIVARLEAVLDASRRVPDAPALILADPRRLGALERTGMMDTDPDEELDLLTRLAAQLLNTPVALVSLVDDKRQFFKSQFGLPPPLSLQRQTPLTHSFCQWVVSSDQELIVSDARTHPILGGYGAMIADMSVIAYAGVPLSAVTGETIGSICAIDGRSRVWSGDELAILRDLGLLVDAYTALNQPQLRADRPEHAEAFRAAAHLAAKGFVGAARLLRRTGGMSGERTSLIGILERQGQRMVGLSDPSDSERRAA